MFRKLSEVVREHTQLNGKKLNTLLLIIIIFILNVPAIFRVYSFLNLPKYKKLKRN